MSCSEMDTFNTKTRVLSEDELPGKEPENGEEVLATLPVKPQERYKFIRTIGFGGMKGVLLVFDQDTGREIAMAIMPDFRERPKADLERFVREAKLTAKLEHPNIVPVHDIGIDASGSPYFTMKYLHGQSLAAMLRKLAKGDPETVSRYGLARMLQIFIRICNAIEFAHSQGICHLDLKPENVNLGDFGEVLVLDWGLARSLRPAVFGGIYAPNDLDQTPAGRVKGTPGYMAPEQIRSSAEFPVDNRADIYSLGAILYAMLALEPPLAHLPMEEVFRRTVTGELPPPSEVAPDDRYIPGALEAICLKAMAVQPEERYNNVAEMREDIFAFQTGYAPKAEKASPLKHAGLFIGRNFLILLILLSLLLAAALVTLAVNYYQAINY